MIEQFQIFTASVLSLEVNYKVTLPATYPRRRDIDDDGG